MSDSRDTVLFRLGEERGRAGRVLREIYRALKESGYDPISQIVGYLLSGDPTYITRNVRARSLIREIERDELIEEMVRAYLRERS